MIRSIALLRTAWPENQAAKSNQNARQGEHSDQPSHEDAYIVPGLGDAGDRLYGPRNIDL